MTSEATIERHLAWIADLYANDEIDLWQLEWLTKNTLEGATPELSVDGGVMITLPPGPDRNIRR